MTVKKLNVRYHNSPNTSLEEQSLLLRVFRKGVLSSSGWIRVDEVRILKVIGVIIVIVVVILVRGYNNCDTFIISGI